MKIPQRKLIIIIVFSVILFLPNFSLAQTPASISLKVFLKEAVENNPKI